MPIYASYAALYEPTGQHAFALLTAAHLPSVLERHPVAGRRLLDLACGTGALAIALARTGWQGLGVDRSAAMLRIARAHVGDLAVRFVQADMRQPPVAPGHFDLVTCTYDSLNYLRSERDLVALCKSAAAALAPGGLLYVDANTRHFLAQRWPALEIIEPDDDLLVLRATFDPVYDTLTVRMTGFVAEAGGGYRRFEEVHVERAFDDTMIVAAAAQAGLRVVGFYDGFSFTAPHATSDRIVWLLRNEG